MDKEFLSLIENQKYQITTLAQSASFFYHNLPNINWAGFYLYQDGKLVLGPYCGKIACEVITLDKGVCGKAATERKTIRVENVHNFAGHIACDSASNSEIVVPIICDNTLFGVLDIDSNILNNFTIQNQKDLESCVQLLENKLIQYKK